jgi:dihydropteroate synthase
MRACLDAGATMINDVSALTWDPAAAALLARHTCPVILMHMRGTPADMASYARYGDVVAEVIAELADRRDAAERAGIARGRILLDPGIGFAKTDAHNFELLARLPELSGLGCPLVVGTSRKRFLGGVGPHDRVGGSIATAVLAAQAGAALVRVHDVAETVQALRIAAETAQRRVVR